MVLSMILYKVIPAFKSDKMLKSVPSNEYYILSAVVSFGSAVNMPYEVVPVSP